MLKRAMTMVVWAAMAAAPAAVGAQAASTIAPPPEFAICDCPLGDTRGGLRDLAAFAPLGLLGALAAAGGAPPLFAGNPVGGMRSMVASGDPLARTETETPIAEAARNATDPMPVTRIDNSTLPEPVSPDSLRASLRAPNTGTPLPSVFLIGSGLIAIGCVAIFRTRG